MPSVHTNYMLLQYLLEELLPEEGRHLESLVELFLALLRDVFPPLPFLVPLPKALSPPPPAPMKASR